MPKAQPIPIRQPTDKPARADGTVRLPTDGSVGRCQILSPSVVFSKALCRKTRGFLFYTIVKTISLVDCRQVIQLYEISFFITFSRPVSATRSNRSY